MYQIVGEASRSWTEGLIAFDDSETRDAGTMRQVLVVEDNPGDANLIRTFLSKAFPHVGISGVSRMNAALDRLSVERFDLVLLDLNLPDSHGTDTLRVLISSAPEVTVVVLTGMDDEVMATECLAMGAQDFIPKAEMAPAFLKRVVAHALSRKRAEQMRHKVAHINRLAALGKIAAGVAHEVNNPATVVMAHLGMARDRINELQIAASLDPHWMTPKRLSEELLDLADMIASGIEGVKAMVDAVSDLRTFSRVEDEPTLVDVEATIKKAIRLLPPEGRLKCQIDVVVEPLPQVFARAQRLLQVFLNLLTNAMHAVDGNVTRPKMIRVLARATDAIVVVRITDNGCGMPEAVRRRVFEPFFTTRPTDIGTGLGLALVADFVAQMGGGVSCHSDEDVGTEFELRLPTKPIDGHGEREQASSLSVGKPSQRLRVLFVDDDPHVLRSVGKLLQIRYDVVESESAQLALTQLAQDQAFDLIIADYNMPEMTGVELFDAICKKFPDLAERFILVSGAEPPFAEQGTRIPDFMAKPFSLEDVARFARKLYKKVTYPPFVQ